jgi:hypothetical protein
MRYMSCEASYWSASSHYESKIKLPVIYHELSYFAEMLNKVIPLFGNLNIQYSSDTTVGV